MNLRHKLILLFITIANFTVQGFAQPQNLQFKHLTKSQGLSGDMVQAIFKDHYGFMWFGTEVGLNKWDGINFTIYRNDVADPHSLGHNHIKAIIEDGDQHLWIATFGGGISRYHRSKDQFSVFKNDHEDLHSLSNDYVDVIYADRNNDIWVGTINGLNKFDRKTQQFIRFNHDPADPGSIPNNSISAIYEDRKGNLWLGTSAGLSLMDRSTGKVIKTYSHQPANSQSISHNAISKITEDKAGNLWVATKWDGLNRFHAEEQTFTRYRNIAEEAGSLGNDDILEIFPDSKGNLWIGTKGGGINYYNTQTDSFSHYQADKSNNYSVGNGAIKAIFEDNSGTLWVASEEGVSYFNPAQQKFQLFRHEYHQNSLSGNRIRSFSEDVEGNIWIAIDGGGLNLYNRKSNSFTAYTPVHEDPNSLSNYSVLSLLLDKQGELWAGTYDGGMDRFDIKNNKFTHYRHEATNPGSLGNNNVKDIIEDGQGRLWIGTSGGGLNSFDKNTNTFTRFPCGDDILSCWINRLFEDKQGNIWIASSWGLGRYDPTTNTFSYFHHDENTEGSLSNNDVFATYQDNKGNIWVGTKNGLNLYQPESNTFKVFKKEDGLPDNSIVSINEDAKGNLWLGTLQGLSAFNPEKNSFRNYTAAVGLQGDEFSVGASLKTSRGELLFGGSAGFNLFHPDSLRDNAFIPPVYLTSFAVFNKAVQIGENAFLKDHINEAKEITLSYLESVFSFEYAALNYIDSDHNQYAYMMEGFDKDWHYVGTEKKATYTNLDPGSYTFRVKASNNDGLWNEEGAAIKLIITPPFWKTWWFRALSVLAMAGVAVSFYKGRIKVIEAQKVKLEKLVKEKTSDLQQANNDLFERQEEIMQQQEELQAQAEVLQNTNGDLQKSQEEIALQRDRLKIVNEQVMSSIQYARSIQKGILPAADKISQVFPEHFIIYRPKDVVSGDFYWFSHLAKEDSGLPADLSFMAAVDCTGHGVPGAFMSIIGSTLLNEIINQKQTTDPAQVLELLDQGVKQAVNRAEGINTAGMDVCLCRFERGEGHQVKILFSGAKRDLMFVKAGSAEVEKLKADRRSIGSNSSNAFTTQELLLDAGSMLYLSTDGYADQNNPAREKLGSHTLCRLISMHSSLAAGVQQQLLEQALDEHQQGAEQRDDITLIGIKV